MVFPLAFSSIVQQGKIMKAIMIFYKVNGLLIIVQFKLTVNNWLWEKCLHEQ
jgi:hypothetical protein